MKRILLDVSDYETRTAVVQDGVLTEIMMENSDNESTAGNIYLGRICAVLPGMQAAFVDIGMNKNAYLYFEKQRTGETKSIKKSWKTGQILAVQVLKEPMGQKGPVVSEKISFTGKFMVLIPNDKEVGVSKKITDIKQREKIKEIVKEILPEGYGAIIRTNGANKSRKEYETEMSLLLRQCEQVLQAVKYHVPPAVLKKESSPVHKAARELFTEDIDEFVINNKAAYDTILKEMMFSDFEKTKLIYYEENTPLFENYYIESQIEKALSKKVWLKSGGFLIIDEIEACVVIDVNTGKFTGKNNFQSTIRKTNSEAAIEVARQIRLRNLSGMIIVDFIDMQEEQDRKNLRTLLEDEVKKDRIQTVVVGMTELGLMQITRKKTNPSLNRVLTTNCRCCNATGRVPSVSFTVSKMRREVVSVFVQTIYNKVIIKGDIRLLKAFAGENNSFLYGLEETYKKSIQLEPAENLQFGYYEIEKMKQNSHFI